MSKNLNPTTIVKEQLNRGINFREDGNYEAGELDLTEAFYKALEHGDQELILEAANALSIQHRLSAGRFNREGNRKLAEQYAKSSLDVYQKLQDLGFFDEANINLFRNYAHALLYAGFTDKAVAALEKSALVQTDPTGVGDEYTHLSAALCYVGKVKEARAKLEEGLNLIQSHNGYPIRLTFALMVRATLFSKVGKQVEAGQDLKQALEISVKNNLAVRKEEAEYLIQHSDNGIDVLRAVAVLPEKN